MQQRLDHHQQNVQNTADKTLNTSIDLKNHTQIKKIIANDDDDDDTIEETSENDDSTNVSSSTDNNNINNGGNDMLNKDDCINASSYGLSEVLRINC